MNQSEKPQHIIYQLYNNNNMPQKTPTTKTEAQMLREYLNIRIARQRVFISSLRVLIEQSPLTFSEAKQIYDLIDREESDLCK